jgi:hypothetical protein
MQARPTPKIDPPKPALGRRVGPARLAPSPRAGFEGAASLFATLFPVVLSSCSLLLDWSQYAGGPVDGGVEAGDGPGGLPGDAGSSDGEGDVCTEGTCASVVDAGDDDDAPAPCSLLTCSTLASCLASVSIACCKSDGTCGCQPVVGTGGCK